MIDFLFKTIPIINFLYTAIIIFCFYTLIIIFWPYLFNKLNLFRHYQGIQRIHEGEVPRLGGLISFFGLCIYMNMIETKDSYLNALCISTLPLILISLKEDIFHNTKIYTRLFIMIVSSVCFFYLYPINFPIIDFPFLNQLINSSNFLSIIFFSFCLVVFMNGNNLIDGCNGLMSATNITQCICLICLFWITNDFIYLNFIIFILIALIIFSFFNFPSGKIFMGDSGAYFFGFMIGTVTIIFFGRHPEIITWNAILILFYPSFELLYSVFRRMFNDVDPVKADINHLHIKLFYILKSKNSKLYVSNSLVTLYLLVIWLMPLLLLVFVYESFFMVIFAIIVNVVTYLGINNLIDFMKNKNDFLK